MNVKHLVEVGSRAVYDKFTDTIPKYKLQVAFMAMIEAIKAASLTESVSIKGFGTFSTTEVKERTVSTIFTKEPKLVEAHKKVSFRPAKEYKSKARYDKQG